jgi:enterochelin esterase family protein
VEENLANNREMVRALRAQGYPAELFEVPDAHNYVAWRDAFDPHLTGLLAEVWGSRGAHR